MEEAAWNRGHCGATQSHEGEACSASDIRGSWVGAPMSARICVALCATCAHCQFVSFSRRDDDCSWFSSCPVLHDAAGATGHNTVRVRASDGSLLLQPPGDVSWSAHLVHVGFQLSRDDPSASPTLRRGCGPGTPPLMATDTQRKPGEGLSHGWPSWKGKPLRWLWEQHVPSFLPHPTSPSSWDIFFVQVGANCGMNTPRCAVGGDPIWEYATQCEGWRGVLVEPQLPVYSALVANYHAAGAAASVLPVRAAIGDSAGVVQMTRPWDRTELASVTQRWANGYSEAVPLMTLSQLWQLTRPPRVDILVVDAEGNEPAILGHGDLPSPLPSLLLFEHQGLSSRRLYTIHANLERQGYRLLDECCRNHSAEPPGFIRRDMLTDILYGFAPGRPRAPAPAPFHTQPHD